MMSKSIDPQEFPANVGSDSTGIGNSTTYICMKSNKQSSTTEGVKNGS